MRAKTKTLTTTSWIILIKHTSRTSKRVHYTVRTQLWNAPKEVTVDALSELFNPNGCRGKAGSGPWKFKSRKEAE